MSFAVCDDDETQYKKKALSVITFHLVYDESDLDAQESTQTHTFKPDMAHQIFGETEMIFGYKHLAINLYYLHNSSKCFVDIQWNEKIGDNESCKADDVLDLMNSWLPMDYRLKRDDFLQDLRLENHCGMYGEVLYNFQDTKGRNYKITLCNTENEEFKNFHQRFETFIVWFIDGANFIDLEDSRWLIFYVYEEKIHPETKKVCCTPVGFCTVYRFFLYPNLTRPRISQFFVLPTFQKRGIGTQLYSTIYNYLRELPDSGDITVEEPTETFQKIRDFCDSLHVYKHLEANHISISTQNQKRINEFLKEHKICKRQAQRVFDVLECLIAHKNGYNEYVKFTNSIKARIEHELTKENRGSKRLCNSNRTSVMSETVDHAVVEAEYTRYIDSLEWPTNRLRATLLKNQ